MGKPKSNLSLHRPKKRAKNAQKAAVKSFWIKTEDEIFGGPSAINYSIVAPNIKSPRTLKGPKVKTFTPSKYYVTLNSPSPKKRVHSTKRMFIRSPRTKLLENTKDTTKTPSKSPSAKKARKCLTKHLSFGEAKNSPGKADDSIHSVNNQEEHFINVEKGKPFHSDDFETIAADNVDSFSDNAELNNTLVEITKLLPVVIESLAEAGYDKTLLDFFKQVSTGQFPLQNISFLLWMEVVKWFSCGNTSIMRYSDHTKKFWKLGYRLFGGRFIHYMGGYKSINSNEESSIPERGVYFPGESEINFAVPDLNILRKFVPYDIPVVDENARKPGILKDMIKSMASAMEDKSCCVTFDGKKLKQGLTKSGGEVDILGFEKDMSIQQKQDELRRTLSPVTELADDLSKHDETLDILNLPGPAKERLKSVLLVSLKEVSSEVLEMKDYRKKKEYTKQKLIERSGECDWRNGKYVHAISSVIAFMHDIDLFLDKCLSIIDEVLKCLCYINRSKLIEGETMSLQNCNSYIEIDNTGNLGETRATRQVKQRTDTWFERRKIAKVTGSTMYKALGLDGLRQQKEHFDTVICGMPEKSFSEKTSQALRYGTDNEPNATATFVGKVMPVLFPNMLCAEEGYVEVGDHNSQPFMIISPDGSVRSTKDLDSTVAGIELKCPVSEVHKEFPPRYLLQCLAEIESLSVDSLIYLCWRPDISTIFRVTKNADLFSRACQLALKLYGSEKPRRQTKLDEETKELKEMIKDQISSNGTVEFVGLVPSLKQDPGANNDYHCQPFLIRRSVYMLKLLSDCFEQYYKLNRTPATEAVVFLCCDLDREWEKNTVRCAPICWFPKGYSLDTETMRKVVENVLDECKSSGLHVPAISFDGQWHNICVRSLENEPLTLLQLQRDLWKRVENMKKETILKALKEKNREPSWTSERKGESSKQNIIICTNENRNVPNISKRVAEQRRKDQKKDDPVSKDGNKKQASENVNKVVESVDTSSADISGNKKAVRVSLNDNSERDQTEQGEIDSDRANDSVIRTETTSASNRDTNQVPGSLNSETATKPLTLNDASAILKMLQTDAKCNSKGQWATKLPQDILDMFKSNEKLKSFRDIELRIIVRYIKRAHGRKINESESKQSKVSKLCSLMGLECKVEKDKVTTRKTYQVKTLSDIAFDVFSKAMKKTDLNIIYSEYLWPNEFERWKQDYPVKVAFPSSINDMEHNEFFPEGSNETDKPKQTVQAGMPSLVEEIGTALPVESADRDKEFWFYSPSHSKTRQQLEISCIDSTHLLTRTRRKCCKGGIENLSNKPWRKVAKQNNTTLSLAMIDCIFEPMSVTTALTHFSESVESEMSKNGDTHAAALCHDIRKWWKAEDDPGIPAFARMSMRMNLRRRLLGYIDFSHFPPPSSHIRGWPSQLWEALVANIDAKCLLYMICRKNTYNVRAFSSMMGETYFSELTLYDRRGHGTVTTEEFGQFIQTSAEKLHMRLDPERTFAYRTTRKTAYKLVGKSDNNQNDSDDENSDIVAKHDEIPFRDHPFDSAERLRLKGKAKEGTIKAERTAIQRGSLGVRWETARRNENKLLPTLRLGIDIKEDE